MIAKAQELNLVCAEVNQAEAMKARIEQENALIVALIAAAESRDVDAIDIEIGKCVEFGIDGREEVVAARQVIDEIIEERARQAALEAEAETQRLAQEAARLEEEKRKLAAEEAARRRREEVEQKERDLQAALDGGNQDAMYEAVNAAMQHGVKSALVDQVEVL
jgi:hypothetical protein